MSKRYRRYEILLPLKFNDGRNVPPKLLSETVAELRRRFHAASHETQKIMGSWEQEGQTYEDVLVRYFVDVPDTAVNQRFFVQYKERLKLRLNQLDIWLTAYAIEVI